jgi:hypothetical protein
MKRLLRDRVTQAYLGRDGKWTSHVRSAEHFENTGVVVMRAQALRQKQLEVVLMLHDLPSSWDIVLPLQLDKRAALQH